MFESTDWEERVRAVELLDDVQVRSIRWRALAKEAMGDRERLVQLLEQSPDMSCLIFARMACVKAMPSDLEVRRIFNERAAKFGDVYAMAAIGR